MKPTLGLLLLACLCLAARDGAAQTLYKLIDKNGKVTYSEKPPKDFDGKVIRLDIDPNANTATLPKPPAPPPRKLEGSDAPAKAREAAKPSREDELAVARDRLESARRAFADARDNPQSGDVAWIGKVGGGARPQPSEDYTRRLADLEARVREAENHVRKLEQGS